MTGLWITLLRKTRMKWKMVKPCFCDWNLETVAYSKYQRHTRTQKKKKTHFGGSVMIVVHCYFFHKSVCLHGVLWPFIMSCTQGCNWMSGLFSTILLVSGRMSWPEAQGAICSLYVKYGCGIIVHGSTCTGFKNNHTKVREKKKKQHTSPLL